MILDRHKHIFKYFNTDTVKKLVWDVGIFNVVCHTQVLLLQKKLQWLK